MVQRLLGGAYTEWVYMDGFCLGHGIDLDRLPLDRVCHVMWWILTRNAGEENDSEKLKRELWMPPKGVAVTDPRSPWFAGNESGGFGALKSSLGM